MVFVKEGCIDYKYFCTWRVSERGEKARRERESERERERERGRERGRERERMPWFPGNITLTPWVPEPGCTVPGTIS